MAHQGVQQQVAHSKRIDVIFSKWRLGNVLFLFESAMTRWIIDAEDLMVAKFSHTFLTLISRTSLAY